MTLTSFPFLSNLRILLLQYPSATKKNPVFSETATSVGWQKCFSSDPGTNFSPRTRSGFVAPTGNWKTFSLTIDVWDQDAL